jgi:hypothetical protein
MRKRKRRLMNRILMRQARKIRLRRNSQDKELEKGLKMLLEFDSLRNWKTFMTRKFNLGMEVKSKSSFWN